MRLKTRVSLLLLSSTLLLFSIIFFKMFSDVRRAAAQSAEMQAQAVARVIEAGLTAHMVSGTMDQRENFIKEVSALEQMKQIWLVRSERVSRQYGKGLYGEEPRDEIDRMVLEKGEASIQSYGGIFEDSHVRVSVPYKATAHGKLDCLSCHNVKSGETLGVISIEMQTNEFKEMGFWNIVSGSTILFILLGGVIYLLRQNILPYIENIEAIGIGSKKALEGDFSFLGENLSKPDKATKSFNELLEKLESSLKNITANLSSMVSFNEEKDRLGELEEQSKHLSEIHRFGQLIDSDANMEEVYTHIGSLLRQEFGVEDFNIIEYDPIAQETQVARISKSLLCDPLSGCRAARTSSVVDSSQMDGICPKMIDPSAHYLCTSYAITDSMNMVLSMVSYDKRQLITPRAKISLLDEYILGSKGEIANQKLSEKLEKFRRVDPQSGLHNMGYLDERMFQIVRESKRTAIPYGVLMMNADKFNSINEVYGTKVADETIPLIGRTLLDSLRESDLVIREKEDQFVVILYDCDPAHVVNVAERVRAIFAKKKHKSHPNGIIKTMSIGAAIFPNQSKSMHQCVEFARIAMSASKTAGGNSVVLYHEGLLEG